MLEQDGKNILDKCDIITEYNLPDDVEYPNDLQEYRRDLNNDNVI
jgi:hypothetical protein